MTTQLTITLDPTVTLREADKLMLDLCGLFMQSGRQWMYLDIAMEAK